jgi:hypothetical protein
MYLGVYAFIRYVFLTIFVYESIYSYLKRGREEGTYDKCTPRVFECILVCIGVEFPFKYFLIPLSSASGFVCTHMSVCVRAYIMYIWRYVHMLAHIITRGYVHRFVCIIFNIQRQSFPNKSETSTYPLECVCIRMYPYSMRAYANIKAHISAQNI